MRNTDWLELSAATKEPWGGHATQRWRGLAERWGGARLLDWLVQAAGHYVLFPAFAIFLLGVIWATTLHRITVERAAAEHATTVLAQDAVTTYEAQAVRALREIEQTLKFVKYVYELKAQPGELNELKFRGLLPPHLIFAVSIADGKGDLVASTSAATPANVAETDYFAAARRSEALFVSRPAPGPQSQEAMLYFCLRLTGADGSFAGVVTVSLPAAYFVSGYEPSKLGEQGEMGLLGTDGVYRARRNGELISAGEVVDYAWTAPGAQDNLIPVTVRVRDGQRRYLSARKIYQFPLTVVVALSEEEQLAGYYRDVRKDLVWASAGSVLLLLLAAVLGRMGWRLNKSRLLEAEQRRLTEQSLRVAAAAFESQEAMVVTDERKVILKVNRAFIESTGYTAAQLVGRTTTLLNSERHAPSFYREMAATVSQLGFWQGEIWHRHRDGSVHPKWLTLSAVKDADGEITNYVGSHYDISERKRAEEKINDLAFYDQLTGLPNRTLLLERLRRNMADSQNGVRAALLFIDLDNFKSLNDTLGHHMGDLLLQQVAQRLGRCLRDGDSLARLGGDEFVVLMVGLSPNPADAVEQAKIFGQHVLATLDQPYQLNEAAYRSTASIGVTLFTGQHTAVDALLKQADLAMYRSKAEGRNALRFFDPAMQATVLARAAMEVDLRRAVEDGQFLLHYQAQIQGNARVTGAEVLLRWQHPTRGLVAPAEFIPLSEETRLILPIGQWVLETACTQLARWAEHAETAHLTLAVNVSAHQFHQQDFVEQVLATLGRTGADPRRLKMELTESLLLTHVDKVIQKMAALKEIGIGFSLDDFGTGFSSLAYLKRLPLDQLKIDRSFVSDAHSDANAAAIAKTVVALAQALGLEVIAEGVETQSQLDFLVGAGCHAYQGYFFSRPLPLEGFEAFAAKAAALETH